LLALRGGSFNNTADNALAAYRNHNQPDNDNNNIGLRWVMCRHIPGAGATAGAHHGAPLSACSPAWRAEGLVAWPRPAAEARWRITACPASWVLPPARGIFLRS
jgi:hypothetical protein